MPAYLITMKNSEDLVTPVHHAGQNGNGDACLLFTDREKADTYITDAGLGESHVVSEVDSVPFVKWLAQADDDGVDTLALNPTHEELQKGVAASVLHVRPQLEYAANHILQLARKDF